VCKITFAQPGFAHGVHYGDGWVITSAHVVEGSKELRQATFTFAGNVVFNPRPGRFAVGYCVKGVDATEDLLPDLMLIKLGQPFAYGIRDTPAQWKDENEAITQLRH